MKSMEFRWGEPCEEFVDGFVSVFGADIVAVLKLRNAVLSKTIWFSIFNRVNDLLAQARLQAYAVKKIKSDIAKIELEILEGKKAKFTFIPLDGNKNFILEKSRCPVLVFPADESDCEKGKKEGREMKLSFEGFPDEISSN